MQNPTDLAQRYFVDDLPGASIPASRLRTILENLHGRRPLTPQGLIYLQTVGLIALAQLARGEVAYEAFVVIAIPEQNERKLASAVQREKGEVALRAKVAEENARQAAYWAELEAKRRARESAPKYIAKMKNRELRERYGIDQFIEPADFPRLMDILRSLDRGNRLSDNDSLWLTTTGKEYFSEELRVAFHNREAEYYATEYKQTDDPWNAVNASSHYRKCNLAPQADVLLGSIPAQRVKFAKLESAIATTHGGVKRDLGKLDEALQLGKNAHTITPKDFRPCTLLGAVNFELGNYTEGREWYAKAIERGATERAVNSDLKGILLRADKARREEIKAFLLAEDPIRYKWVKTF